MILSIIIPVFNVEKYVERCLVSCINQNISTCDYEIIVINDGSTDNSLDVIERIADQYSNIKVFNQANMGLSVARNVGMSYASGDYFMFVDSDDWISPNCLCSLVKKLNQEKPDALAICAANVINGVPERRMSYVDESPISGCQLLRSGISPCAPFSIWNAAFLKKNNLSFYEGIYHEDSEFTPRAYYLAQKVSFTNELIYFVYQNPNSITRSVNPKKAFDLVNVVCSHLYQFSLNIKDEDKPIFNNLIAMYLNNAMFGILATSKSHQLELNNIISRNRYLYSCIADGTRLKYRIESFLLKIFPRNPLKVYIFLGCFKKR